MPRLLDILFFFYFFTHIPITIFIDLQALLPQKYFPQKTVELKDWYCLHFRDPMMVDPPTWFQAFVGCEFLVQLPFFFVAAYGFFKGAEKCPWLRWPCVVYGSHVATTLIPIISHILLHDFSTGKHPGPRNMEERFTLISIYCPYFFFPLFIMLDALFSSVYRHSLHLHQKKHR
ncbi:sigma intracellular receptor 2 [Aplysia californica]|uniref:Sigma intracellular receptor 2 n=1 Tax=Aplysia californica TaxID=6500 RepID=A0ABM0K967_APLCA|nr:sigma intracellular receptor 2 [Aplysia californica]